MRRIIKRTRLAQKAYRSLGIYVLSSVGLYLLLSLVILKLMNNFFVTFKNLGTSIVRRECEKLWQSIFLFHTTLIQGSGQDALIILMRVFLNRWDVVIGKTEFDNYIILHEIQP